MKLYFDGSRKNIVADRIRELRRRSGLSQEDLSRKLAELGVKIDQQMISRIERAERSVADYELAGFCVLFGVEPNDLLAPFLTSSL